jgi:hypothetical protein
VAQPILLGSGMTGVHGLAETLNLLDEFVITDHRQEHGDWLLVA